MDIGNRIKNLRLSKNLTQEELGERTDLSKGYISQLERNLSSPSIETLFALLEVLGIKPKDFFDEDDNTQKVVYGKEEHTFYEDEEKGYQITWLVPESNEQEMEPVFVEIAPFACFKPFEPSLAETFAYVLEGTLTVALGEQEYQARAQEAVYFTAHEAHQLKNLTDTPVKFILVATDSYL
ncbi:helix-turn-helix domain-containing protein [Listeria costaricensis]|uniref:helix-turn-helix domain-containing protein n=1 Tax=Listeria costaricensis TaxID=2026604 RepID=UPI000C0857D3|nr:XRE family transcriptional regulator [Listeria costaricensis]